MRKRVPKIPLAYRFIIKVKIPDDDGCWMWVGRKNTQGYGWIAKEKDGKNMLAHRASYQLFIGKIPKGKLVCHNCDVPSCVNPKHLWIGTNRDNTNDRDNKGRQKALSGEKCGKSKLTWKKVDKIRDDYMKKKATMLELANRYAVDRATIGYILNYHTWRR